MISVIAAVCAHVVAADAIEEQLASDIASGFVTTSKQINAANWPANG